MPRVKKSKKELELIHRTGSAFVDSRPDDDSTKIERGTKIDPPDTIKNEKVKRQWEIVVSELVDFENLSPMDLPSLEQAFIFLEEYHEDLKSIKAIRNEKETITDADRLNRLYKLNASLSKSSKEYHSIMGKFGVTPSERSKVSLFEKKEKPVDVISSIIGD